MEAAAYVFFTHSSATLLEVTKFQLQLLRPPAITAAIARHVKMAYAAVSSLLQTLDLTVSLNVDMSPQDSKNFAMLGEKLTFLIGFLERSVTKQGDCEKVNTLETKIENAVHRAEDIIETHSYSMRNSTKGTRKSRKRRYKISHQGLIEALEEIEAIVKEAVEISENRHGPSNVHAGQNFIGSSSWHSQNAGDSVVGLDKDLLKIKDQLTGSCSNLEILTILGMGGIGKSTLAKKIYDDKLIVYHFYVRAWITVSQEYEVKNILLGLIRSVAQQTDDICSRYEESDERQRQQIHRRLCTHSDIFPYAVTEYSNPQVRTFLSSNLSAQLLFLEVSFLSRMGFRLLRVLDILSYYFSQFPVQVLKLVHLRYLGLSTSGDLPSEVSTRSESTGKWCLPFPKRGGEFHVSISDLMNLQILIVHWGSQENHILPFDIRMMSQLRHVRLRGGVIYFDNLFLEEESSFVLLNLQTLLTMSSHNFSNQIGSFMPNLKTLGILVNDDDNLENLLNCLSSLQHLEKLKLSFRPRNGRRSSVISQWDAFPPNLKALTLSGSHLPWIDMVSIGLKVLQVLASWVNAASYKLEFCG
ncbi:Unknown protein [Striga hermonthica]|uniref:NB-ARC domain-containing protein n=1 Tax=Striga hermonthica TaxID=68872 RepID=A0A9N7MMR5_STRHE|nr:Unknown protein [Striga hermonthica]